MPKSKPDTEASAPWAGNAEKTKLLSGSIVDSGVSLPPRDEVWTTPYEKQNFLDMVASQLFVAGWPQHDIYSRAEVLWKHRLAHIAKGNKP